MLRVHELLPPPTAIDPSSSSFAYIESRSKEAGKFVDVSIKVHVHDSNDTQRECDIESYNPYFGCSVSYFRWIDDAVILVYTEKHETYIARLDESWPPEFIEIESRWTIQDTVLAYIGYNENLVRRLAFPALEIMEPVSISDAERNGYLPQDPITN